MQTSSIALAFLLIAIATIMELDAMIIPAPTPSRNSAVPPYQLVFETDSTTEHTGSVILKCRDSFTAQEKDINEISFFLNHSSAADPSLREREDIRVVEVGTTGIKFNLTRKYEGYYTCGTNVQESPSIPMICK